SNRLEVRQAASMELSGYVDPKSDIRLTVGQLQTLRAYAHGTGNPHLDLQTRAAGIIRLWTQLNPTTTKPAKDFLEGLKITDWKFDPISRDGSLQFGAVKIAFDEGGIKFSNELVAAYWRAIAQYNDGLTHNVVPRLAAIRKLVQDLTDEDLKHLVYRKDGEGITKDQ